MAKIFHCADLHLDSPFSGQSAERSLLLRRGVFDTFKRAVERAYAERCDLFIIAGDMFDSEFASPATLEAVMSLFESHGKMVFAVSPGNHDPYSQNSFWKRAKLPQNAHVFSSDRLTKFSMLSAEGEKLSVYGYAFTSSTLDRSPFAAQTPKDPGIINIVCAHADIYNPLAKNAFITPAEIAKTGFDYIALGHIHNPPPPAEQVQRAGTTHYAYSGALAGRGFDECGERGGLLLEMKKIDSELSLSYSFISLSEYIFLNLAADVTGAADINDVLAKISPLSVSVRNPQKTALRLTLTGDTAPGCRIGGNSIAETFGPLFSFELQDFTAPLFDADALRNDKTIRGAFFRALLPKLESDDLKTRAAAREALEYGLRALAGNL
ncbi:MAG TPA: DNA repair exonuclease [Clostridiales bacterium]|jgi:DNA repair exonuclease SbcCD nuclease subunit|nr:DNA repair exonuclease [Clostridiales bacterium]